MLKWNLWWLTFTIFFISISTSSKILMDVMGIENGERKPGVTLLPQSTIREATSLRNCDISAIFFSKRIEILSFPIFSQWSDWNQRKNQNVWVQVFGRLYPPVSTSWWRSCFWSCQLRVLQHSSLLRNYLASAWLGSSQNCWNGSVLLAFTRYFVNARDYVGESRIPWRDSRLRGEKIGTSRSLDTLYGFANKPGKPRRS